MVGLAAGSLLGCAFFHMLPESVDALDNGLGICLALTQLVFFLLTFWFMTRPCGS